MTTQSSINVSTADSKVATRLEEYLKSFWAPFITSFDLVIGENNESVFSIQGDPVGLKLVLQNIKKAKWDISIIDLSESKKSKKTLTANNKEKTNKLRIMIPAIEQDWESGVVKFPSKPAKSSSWPKELKDCFAKQIPGWRINYAKCSIGVVVDLGQPESRKKFRDDVELGWGSWQVLFDHSKSNFSFYEIIDPDDSRVTFSEISTVYKNNIFNNLEEIPGIKFLIKKSVSLELERPLDSTLYNIGERGEDPWEIVHMTESGEKSVYDSSEKILSTSEIKSLLITFCS